MGFAAPSRYTRYPATPAPTSAEAVQLSCTCVAELAVAVTPAGTEGARMSGEFDGGGVDPPSSPPQAAHVSASTCAARPARTRRDTTDIDETSEPDAGRPSRHLLVAHWPQADHNRMALARCRPKQTAAQDVSCNSSAHRPSRSAAARRRYRSC